jgi:hypothetical protein
MSGAEKDDSWEARYLASIADEQRALDDRDPSAYAASVTAAAYVRLVFVVIGLVVGGIVLISTRNPWTIFIGAAVVVTVLLGATSLLRRGRP